MSFKRDGDDSALLSRIQSKRVTDLLGEHVPENEAKLLSNGRLTCLICTHRPVFDCMKTLIVHRTGKKHVYELSLYLERKQEIEFKNLKLKQLDLARKEIARKSDILGPKTGPLSKESVSFKRKEVISLKPSHKLNPVKVKSVAGQVRSYLKEISKKTPLSKVVEMQKESYPETEPDTRECSSQDLTQLPEVTKLSHKMTQELLSVHMSGYIKDKFGNLMKDPNAEFDSDED